MLITLGSFALSAGPDEHGHADHGEVFVCLCAAHKHAPPAQAAPWPTGPARCGVSRLTGKDLFRYNNRENPYMFRDVMLKLLLAENLTLLKLIED